MLNSSTSVMKITIITFTLQRPKFYNVNILILLYIVDVSKVANFAQIVNWLGLPFGKEVI